MPWLVGGFVPALRHCSPSPACPQGATAVPIHRAPLKAPLIPLPCCFLGWGCSAKVCSAELAQHSPITSVQRVCLQQMLPSWQLLLSLSLFLVATSCGKIIWDLAVELVFITPLSG